MSSGIHDIKNKLILITGSAKGIGFALAEGLASEGAHVILNDIDPDSLNTSVEKLKAEGLNVSGYSFDVTNEDAVKLSISLIQKQLGPVDVLFNNAGINLRGNLEDFSTNDWKKVIDINLTGPYMVSKHVVKSMIERRGGKIINICSLMSELGRPTIAAYAASKGGLKMLTKAMTTEWAKYNIQINGIGPGYFATEMNTALVADEKFNNWICSRTPAGRWGKVQELVGPAIFLASKASDFVNGQIIYVDGGLLACI